MCSTQPIRFEDLFHLQPKPPGHVNRIHVSYNGSTVRHAARIEERPTAAGGRVKLGGAKPKPKLLKRSEPCLTDD